jgi:hypothetical protein
MGPTPLKIFRIRRAATSKVAVASATPLQSGLRGAAAASAERPLGLIAPTGKIALPDVRERGGKSERPNEGQARQGCAATSREDGILPRPELLSSLAGPAETSMTRCK